MGTDRRDYIFYPVVCSPIHKYKSRSFYLGMPDDHPISKIRRVIAHTMILNQPYDILIQSSMAKNGEGKKGKTATSK